MKIAHDLGNGYVKSTIDGERVKVPSVIAKLRPQDIQDPVAFTNHDQEQRYFDHFLDHMDVSINSSTVKTQGRFLVGEAAVDSSLPLTEFDVSDLGGKSETDLAVILTLALIAGKRVKEAYAKEEDLSKPLTAEVVMATALPVSEGKRNGASDAYKQRYLGRSHTVTFNNFTNPITVKINFKSVGVALEGETAALYIRMGQDDQLKQALKKDFDANYPAMADAITAEDFQEQTDLLLLDIGAGTTDAVAIVNGRANANASLSLPYGYGNVLQDAIEELQMEQINFDERAQLEAYLAAKPSAFERDQKKHVQKVVREQLENFEDRVVQAASTVVRKAAAAPKVVLVLGGGSIPMQKSELRHKLTEKMRMFAGGHSIPVVWIDAKHAQELNQLGLEAIVESD